MGHCFLDIQYTGVAHQVRLGLHDLDPHHSWSQDSHLDPKSLKKQLNTHTDPNIYRNPRFSR